MVQGGIPMRLHLVDGTFELYRAHFAPRPDRPLKATAGLLASMLALLHEAEERVTHLAIAFDNPIRSFRNDLFEGYKSDEGVPPDLRAQFDLAERACSALGIAVFSMQQFEADDAMATAAARFRDQVEQVRLLTPDKDLGQCLDGQRVVLVDRIRKVQIDQQGLWERRGVRPASVPDLLALTGDDADGIPGLPGFGEKTAAALLAQFDHLERIPELPLHWPKSVRGALRLSATLREQRAEALLYRELATLRLDAPVATSLEQLRFGGVPRKRFAAFCEEIGAKDLIDRPTRWADQAGASSSQ
jgi:5'-3' exonuclease